jgi:hypothetical protein
MDYADALRTVDSLQDASDPVGSSLRILHAFRTQPGLEDAYGSHPSGNPITVTANVDPMRMAQNMLDAVQSKGAKWAENIQRPKVNPQQAAAAAGGKWWGQLQAAQQANRYVSGVRGYNLDEAINSAIADGGAAWVAGIQKRQPKIQRGMVRAAQMLNAVSAAVRAMPQDTPAQRDARALAMMQGMRAAKAGTSTR